MIFLWLAISVSLSLWSPSIALSVGLSFYLSISLPVSLLYFCLPLFLPVCLSITLPIYHSVNLSFYLSFSLFLSHKHTHLTHSVSSGFWFRSVSNWYFNLNDDSLAWLISPFDAVQGKSTFATQIFVSARLSNHF